MNCLRSYCNRWRSLFFRYFNFPDRDKSSPEDKGDGDRNDSIWAVVAGIVKSYNLPIDYVLYEMSYANMIMYASVLPGYSDKNKGAGKDNEVINADDPKNRDKVRSILFGG
ncbi:MAG: hypothetical protein LBH58_02665 [Tannerellaceae bacterium]|nr:hypothetical protein [Tannerellaceae bacterium]